MVTITRNADLCTKCGTCVPTCPMSIYVQKGKDTIPEVTNIGFCVSCGHCVAVCPRDAIVHSEFPGGFVKQINRESLPSPEGVLEFIRTRRSIRAFKDKPVERHLIEEMIEAARFAPSAHNTQTTEFIVIQDKEMLKDIIQITARFYEGFVAMLRNPVKRQMMKLAFRKQAGSIIGMLPAFERLITDVRNGIDPVLRDAPVLLLFHADESIGMADINAQLALQNAALMAHALGLGSFWTGFLVPACWRTKTLRQLVKLPEGHKIYGGLAVGYPQFQYRKWMERKTPKITWL